MLSRFKKDFDRAIEESKVVDVQINSRNYSLTIELYNCFLSDSKDRVEIRSLEQEGLELYFDKHSVIDFIEDEECTTYIFNYKNDVIEITL